VTTVESEQQLRDQVNAQLQWDPSLTEADIVVTVASGVVTLSGSVPFFAEKAVAERASQRVVGVVAIVEAMTVRASGAHQRSDAEIATAVVAARATHVSATSARTPPTPGSNRFGRSTAPPERRS
jgi:BON domain